MAATSIGQILATPQMPPPTPEPQGAIPLRVFEPARSGASAFARSLPIRSDQKLNAAEWKYVDPLIRARLFGMTAPPPDDKCEWPILLHGPAGTGKSCIAALLYRNWPGYPLWLDAGAFVIQMMTARRDGAAPYYHTNGNRADRDISENGMINWMRESPLVVLDDIGNRRPTDAQFDALLAAINARSGKPLIITTNCNPEQLTSLFDDRFASRLLAGTVIEVGGQDRRLA